MFIHPMIRFIKKILFTLLLITILCIACTSASRFGTQEMWVDSVSTSLSQQEDYPDAGAVILLDEARLELFRRNDKPYSVIHRHTVVKVLNERGFQFANVVIPYESGTRISQIQARTILSDRTVVPLLSDQIFDTNLNSEMIYYSDIRAKRFTMPAVEIGSVVEYRWRKTINEFCLWTYWPFQREEPILLSKYSVIYPREMEISFKTYGDETTPEMQAISLGDKIERIWEVNNAPAFIPEISTPPGNTALGHMMFSPLGVRGWADISEWYLDLSEERMRPDEQVKKITMELMDGSRSPIEKMKRIFEYVRDNVRYIAIEVGIGSYQPHFAGTVLRNSFGDCKDMTTLIVAMGRVVDIEVHPVLISTWHNGQADSSLVSQAYFNHVIALAILDDGTEIWMDATDKKCPFGDLPWYDQGRMVLVASPTLNTRLRRTPSEPSSSNLSERLWEISLDTLGHATGSFRMHLSGAQALEFRRQIHSVHPNNLYAWINREVFQHYPITIDTTVSLTHERLLSQPVGLSCTFTSSHIVLKSQDLFTFFPDAMSTCDWHRLFPSPYRRYDISLRHPLEINDHIVLRYPDNWDCISTTLRDSLACPYGDYYWHMVFPSPGKAEFSRTFRITSPQIHKDDYAIFRKFLNDINLSEQTLILFSSQNYPHQQ